MKKTVINVLADAKDVTYRHFGQDSRENKSNLQFRLQLQPCLHFPQHKMKFSVKDFFSKCEQIHNFEWFSCTKEILNSLMKEVHIV